MRFVRGLLVVFGLLTALYVYFATLHPHQELADHVFFDAPEPWAIAHQGGRGLWPENTLYAFDHAKELGVDVLEMDLRATVDGEIVVMHDASVDRTTDGSGRVDQMTLAEVQALDAGYRFTDAPDQFRHRGQGLTVPTLEDVLTRFPDARMILEMKEFTPELATKFCASIKKRRATDRVLVASFGHDAMQTFRNECPNVATSATLREGLLLYQLNRMQLASLYRSPAVALQIPEALGERRVLDPRLLTLAAAFNVKVQVWTVNDEEDMKRLLGMGVHGIMTDYPDRLLRVLRLMGRRESASSATTR